MIGAHLRHDAKPWPGLLLLLLAAALLVYCAAEHRPPMRGGLAPVTVFSAFKQTSTAFLDGLNKMSADSAYTAYLKAIKAPVVKNKQKQTTFKANLQKILQLNKDAKSLKHVFGINKFTQMTPKERSIYLGLRKPGKTAAQAREDNIKLLRTSAQATAVDMEAAALQAYSAAATRAGTVKTQQVENIPDWTSVLPSIKNQGGCGSCWAFASTAVTEAASFVNTGSVISLSEKQLVDCNLENSGCDGGWYDPAFQFIVDNGVTSSALYPYVARQDSCSAGLTPVSRLASYTPLKANNEDAMLQALQNGPIAVAVTVDDAFQAYSGGVFTSSTCNGPINHAVVVVGAGRDDDLGVDYWLIRNSWGEDWGEGGYMRILRGAGGSGMCNVAAVPYQVESADQGGPAPPPAPGPDPGCKDQTITVDAKTSLADVAKQYQTTTAQIQLDNDLNDPMAQLSDGQELLITCPVGLWSEPYGVWDNWNAQNALTAVPAVHNCPDGSYAVSFYIKPSQWYADDWTGSTWVGRVTMTCSDGSEFTIDAQPDFDPGWADGTVDKCNGFMSVSLSAGGAVDSLFGVGAQSGGEQTFNCPADTVVTGFAGGASPSQYPQGWISNLQFRCSNPFGVGNTKIKGMLKSSFPKVPSGVSCKTYTTKPSDTWQKVALAQGVLLTELIRVNPSAPSKFSTNPRNSTKLFIPPCNEGMLQGTRVSGKAVAMAMNTQQPLAKAIAAAKAMPVEALVVTGAGN